MRDSEQKTSSENKQDDTTGSACANGWGGRGTRGADTGRSGDLRLGVPYQRWRQGRGDLHPRLRQRHSWPRQRDVAARLFRDSARYHRRPATVKQAGFHPTYTIRLENRPAVNSDDVGCLSPTKGREPSTRKKLVPADGRCRFVA